MSDSTPTSPASPTDDDLTVPAPLRHGSDAFLHRGDTVGPYHLLEQIGEGGFGTVWLAERRDAIVQRVALKVLNPGMDTREVLARFEQERQALAVMNHPNVAKVFDAGATEYIPGRAGGGRPYFAMEHVPGEPITGYCDRQRLSIRERLELFIPVCEAVQHAHHKGIIHRDIKPSNILVAVHEGRAVPKVIDFGVAKAVSHTLTAKTIFTEHGRLIGTPEYMSPEQAEMGATDVDTRTDVYALGVVLYELLSGLLPFDSKTLRAAGMAAICKIIREQEPPRPSTRLTSADAAASAGLAASRHTQREQLTRELRRELDWIPLKAIRKDRAERYDTPMDLAQDIGRYLKGEALKAGPESAGYRLRKFVRRNRGPVVAGSAVLLAIVLGMAATLWMWNRATNAAALARTAESDARESAVAENEARVAEYKARRTAEAKSVEVEAKSRTIEYNTYVANIQMAAAAMDFGQFDRVRQRLDACPEQLRGWEWRWLDASTDNSLFTLNGHSSRVWSAAFSPDGTRIVTASTHKTARLWDIASQSTIAELKGHTDYVIAADFSPDGTRIVTASFDKTARVWDIASKTTIAKLKGHLRYLHSASFSPDGTRIVTAGGDDTALVWDIASQSAIAKLKGHTKDVRTAAFSPDGTRIVTASDDGTARVWDIASQSTIAELRGHTFVVRTAAFSPDGTRIVTASFDKTARVWDIASRSTVAEFKGHTLSVLSAAFSADGKRIVTASSDQTARVWDIASQSTIATLKGHASSVRTAAFSPDGTRIVTASDDGTARVWDAASGASLAELLGHTKDVRTAAFSPDGTRIVTASGDGTARVWDIASQSAVVELRGHTLSVLSAAFSPEGTRVVTASADKTVRVWNATSGASLAELLGHSDGNLYGINHDGTRIATASRDNIVRVLDIASQRTIAELKGHTSYVHSAVFCLDGTRIVTASRDKSARVWDIATHTTIAVLMGHTADVLSAAFSPDGTQIVTASNDSTARVWDIASQTPVAMLKGQPFYVKSAAFSPDGTRIVTASGDDTACVWDIASQTKTAELKGHTGTVHTAAFSPDGTRVVTGSEDKTVRVWDIASQGTIAELKGHAGGVYTAAFSPDGTRIVTGSNDNTARVWESMPFRERFPLIQRARAAASKMAPFVEARLKAGELPQTVRSALNADATLTSEERTAALAQIQLSLDGQSRAAMNQRNEVQRPTAAWEAIRFAPVELSVASKAVADVRRTIAPASEQGLYLNTLGVGLYRAGNYRESLDTLTRSAAFNAKTQTGDQPGDWAFIAMARWQLHQEADARAALTKLRDLAATDRWKADDETVRWLEEAEALIDPPPP